MKLLLIDSHDGEGAFPVFPKGSIVENAQPSEECAHWMPCMIDGKETFLPDIYLTDNRLNVDYDPTELVLEKGEVVELLKVVCEWLYVRTKDGVSGWLPAAKLVSMDD